MTDENQQTTDQTENQTDDGSDLDNLLSEYEKGTQKETKETKETRSEPKQTRHDPVKEWARQEMIRRQREDFEKDIGEAVKTVHQAESLKGLSDTLVRRLLIAHATENPEFEQAFNERQKNPKAWKSALKEAEKALSEEFKDIPKMSLREDVEAAKATVNGVTSEKTSDDPDPIELMDMSDADYQRFVEKHESAVENRS